MNEWRASQFTLRRPFYYRDRIYKLIIRQGGGKGENLIHLHPQYHIQ